MQFLSQKLSLKKLTEAHKKRFLKVLIFLMATVLGFLGFWFALRVALNTEYPIMPVSSGSMCVFQPNCDDLTHPFDPTLHVGDLIIVQGVDARSVRDAYPDSDVLVFSFPKGDAYQDSGLTITRVIKKEERNDVIYFRTKGDGEGIHIWPETPDVSECDRWYDYRENYTCNGMISEKLLVGKVVFRIPWIGYVALFMQTSAGVFMIVVLIIIILIVEFAIPAFISKKAEIKLKKSEGNASET